MKRDSNGLSLLKRGQKGLIHAIFSRMGLILILLLIQVFVLFSVFQWFAGLLPYTLGGTALFITLMVLYLLNSSIDPTAKITWLVIIMLAPVFGALLFWYTQSEIGHRAVKARLSRLTAQTRSSIPQSPEVLAALEAENPGAAALARYIRRSGCYPVFDRLLSPGGGQMGGDAPPAGAGGALYFPGVLHCGRGAHVGEGAGHPGPQGGGRGGRKDAV